MALPFLHFSLAFPHLISSIYKGLKILFWPVFSRPALSFTLIFLLFFVVVPV